MAPCFHIGGSFMESLSIYGTPYQFSSSIRQDKLLGQL